MRFLLIYVFISHASKVERQFGHVEKQFLVGRMSRQRRIHLIKLGTVCWDKKFGDLDSKILELQNKSLLMKWHWRFNDDKNDLWMNLVIVKYRKTEEWCTDSAKGAYVVSMWKYTRRL